MANFSGHFESILDSEVWPQVNFRLWAAEVDPRKRALLLSRSMEDLVPLQHVFGDVRHVATPGPAWDYKQTALLEPAAPDIALIGFPCVDLSPLNPKRHVIKFDRHGPGKSGSVFFACVDIIAKYLPPWVVLENVLGILHRKAGDDESRALEIVRLSLNSISAS